MTTRVYCITALLGMGVALLAGALFASDTSRIILGLTLGVAMLLLGYLITLTKGE